MPLLNRGSEALASYSIGDGLIPLLNNANAHLAVGDSTTTFDKAHTDLQASTNKSRKPMDTGYPIRTGAGLQYRSTWGLTEAVHAWAEWGVAFAASGANTMFSRKVEALGTKPNTQSWQLLATGTVAA